MRKTSVYLTDEERQHLARVAELEGVSQARVIREAIAAYRGSGGVDREFRLEGIAIGPGGSIADVADEELLAGFGD
jgi:predicted transcriptional regulator